MTNCVYQHLANGGNKMEWGHFGATHLIFGNTLTFHVRGRRFKPRTLCGKGGNFSPIVGSLQYKTLTNCMYWFPLPLKLRIMI